MADGEPHHRRPGAVIGGSIPMPVTRFYRGRFAAPWVSFTTAMIIRHSHGPLGPPLRPFLCRLLRAYC